MSASPAETRREYFKQRLKELEGQRDRTGKLRRQDWWSLEYFQDPYLIYAANEKLHKRYQDISGNLWELDESGKIAPVTGKAHDTWMSLALHVQEELFSRGIMPQRADEDIHLPAPSFPDTPPGLKILANARLPKAAYLVKCGKEEHIRSMIEAGNVQISPASLYSNQSLISAIRDGGERELFACRATSSINGNFFDLDEQKTSSYGEGEIEVRRSLPNFYMFCSSYKYDYRLLSDFGSNAVAVIERPELFLRQLTEAVSAVRPDLRARFGEVRYYDPYFVVDWNYHLDGFLKHFRYAYQKEFRVCWDATLDDDEKLEPFIVNVGSMADYTKLLVLPKS